MKKNVNYVDGSKFETILTTRNLSFVPQAGFIKVSGAKGRNLYIARTKRVGRVDLSGFEAPVEMGVIALGGESFGAVTQQLDFSQPEETILTNFTAILDHMLALPAREVAKKVQPGKAPAPKAVGWSAAAKPVSEMNDEERAKRMALIARVAAEKGVKVSSKAEVNPDQA